ncbi:MAG: hypothetical protein ABI377_01645 [Devosia sp.]
MTILITNVLRHTSRTSLDDLDERLLNDIGAKRNRLPILLFSERIAETNRIRGI